MQGCDLKGKPTSKVASLSATAGKALAAPVSAPASTPATPVADRAETPTPLASLCVRALLDRSGVPRHRQSAHLAALLQMSYHQAHRRMLGTAPWVVDELQAVAAHHGETLVDLFGQQKASDYENGVLIAGPLRVSCRLWPGPQVVMHRPGDLIAIKGGAEWVVMVAGDAHTPQACSVRRLIIDQKPDRPRRVAVLDDDVDVARGLASGLAAQGFEALPFATSVQLEAALQAGSFDGYVVDWILGRGTAYELLSKLRALSPTAPIALLTGKLGTPEVDEKAMASAIQQLSLLFMQKPVTAALAASQFSAWFASR